MHVNHPSRLPTSSQYDVIIVGARAAGAATALTLARNGLHVVLVEQSALGTDTASTHALMRGAVMQLSNWGLLDEIIEAGTPAVRRTTFDYGGERIVISIKPSHGVDALYAPRRTLLDPIIVRAALAAGAELCDRTAASELVWRGERVVGVRVRSAEGSTRDLQAPIVIGADGIRSIVARQVSAPITRSGRSGGAVSYGYWSDLDVDGYEWVFRQHGCAGAIPTNDGAVCVFASAPSHDIGRGGVDVIESIVAAGSADLAERLRRATPPRGTRTWSGRPGYIRRSHGPGWALVGDAGYFKDPISAHGLTDALRDAGLLGRAIVDGFADGGSMDDALADYEATRDRLSVPLFDIVDRIASHEWDDVEIGDLLICLSSAMADEVEAIAALQPEPASWPS